MMNKYLVPMLVIILFLFSSFIVTSSPKEKLTIDDEWKYDFPPGYSDNLDYSKATRFVDHYEKEYSLDNYIYKETLISENPPIMSDNYMNLHMWPMQGYNRQHVGRSPYSTEDNPGIEKWRFTASDWTDGSPVIGSDGTIYFGGDNYLHALYPNGTLKWKYATEWGIGSFGISPAIADDGTIYFGQKFGDWLYALNPNGTKKWKCQTGEIFTSITIDNDGVLYYGLENRLEARYPNATLKWSYHTGNFVQSTPAIDDNGIIYFGSHDHFVYALYPNGTLMWRFQTGDWVHGSPTVGPDETVYVGSDDDYLYALHPENGTMKWRTHIDSGMRSSPSLDKNGNLYFGVWSSKIYSVDPNGTIRWIFPLRDGDSVWGSTPAISDDGTIYIGNGIDYWMLGGGEIIALNPDGTEKWRKILCNSVLESSPVISEDGVIYICASNDLIHPDGPGHLHAFGPQDSNIPPETPTIEGPSEGQVGERYIYYFSTDDADNNPVAYFVDWGDGDTYGWTEDYSPGVTKSTGHTWDRQGEYTIKVKARDTFGAESDWAYLEVTMPVNQQIGSSLFLRFLERFPNAFPILRYLFGL